MGGGSSPPAVTDDEKVATTQSPSGNNLAEPLLGGGDHIRNRGDGTSSPTPSQNESPWDRAARMPTPTTSRTPTPPGGGILDKQLAAMDAQEQARSEFVADPEDETEVGDQDGQGGQLTTQNAGWGGYLFGLGTAAPVAAYGFACTAPVCASKPLAAGGPSGPAKAKSKAVLGGPGDKWPEPSMSPTLDSANAGYRSRSQSPKSVSSRRSRSGSPHSNRRSRSQSPHSQSSRHVSPREELTKNQFKYQRIEYLF